MQTQRPSLFRVISVDYPSLLAALFPVVFWVWTAYYFYAGSDSLQFFLLVSSGITLVAIPFLFWRYRNIASVFEEGLESPGVIMAINFFRGRGRVDYAYTFQGQKLVSGNAINRTRLTKELRVGQAVTLVIDRNNPKRAFVKEIYL
ncbi:MAG: hypothetical protein EHM40_18915 [Chloroflexi bacterium]|nr:MAG: hypothetical protein EHM40_18915 [Chloroflexota bacterium]